MDGWTIAKQKNLHFERFHRFFFFLHDQYVNTKHPPSCFLAFNNETIVLNQQGGKEIFHSFFGFQTNFVHVISTIILITSKISKMISITS